MSIPQRLTEEQIAAIVKRDTDTLDGMLQCKKITRDEYNWELLRIAKWALTAWKRPVFAE